MFTKPCERSGRGCCGVAWAHTEKILARRRFCSPQCTFRDRIERGWTPPRHQFAFEECQRGGRKGGPIAGARRRQKAVLSKASKLRALLPQDFRAELSARHEALILALLVKAMEMGCAMEANADRRRPRGHRETERQAA